MSELAQLFLNNILPVLLAVITGYLAARFLNVNPRGLSRVTFYIFSPCLIFSLITNSELSNGDILQMAGFTTLLILLVGAIAWILTRLLGFNRRMQAAVLLTSMFMNAGNFGLAVVNFGFSDQALAYASIFFVTNAVLAYTVGVFIASLGNMKMRDALFSLLKVPAIYAVMFAVLFFSLGWELPGPIDKSIGLLADAAIPVMLVLLGLQLYSASWSGNLIPLTLSSTIRLIVSPLIALGMVAVFTVSKPFSQAAVLQAGMPTAVLMTVIATEYDTHPRFVTSVVFVTTLVSLLTLTFLLNISGS